MKYRINDIKQTLEIATDSKKLFLSGYAIIDEKGHCFIIVHGEDKRDIIYEYLNECKF